jgi:hypothetical protein
MNAAEAQLDVASHLADASNHSGRQILRKRRAGDSFESRKKLPRRTCLAFRFP